ncbi:MAG TPA: hypothetical protein PKE66_10850, partial [Pyrinomonadaceae bacterium]|nr:hypothetical protein [Pyrinomonadaceae bacterium]
MKNSLIPLILIVSMVLPAFGAAAPAETADLVISGGKVVTMDAGRRVIEDGAVAIREGKIVAVGSRAEVVRGFRARRTINAAGKVVIPGLIN